jgi:hypothetical protein
MIKLDSGLCCRGVRVYCFLSDRQS